MKGRFDLKSLILNNGSYKLVALIVSLVLWVTILGRKSTMPIECALAPYLKENHEIRNTIRKTIKFNIYGPKVILEKLSRHSELTAELNLRSFGPGVHKVELSNLRCNFPTGVNVVSVQPSVLTVHIGEAKNANTKGAGERSE